MIVLDRENIINGLIELREEEDYENNIIVLNIKRIINSIETSNLEKLKMINSELAKVISI